MRALAPLPAFLLLAASAAACPFGFTGHIHASVDSPAPAVALPEGRCTGQAASAPGPVRFDGAPYDLRSNPVPAEHRPYWESIGYRFDEPASRLRDASGAVITQAEIDDLQKPIDTATERLDAVLWQSFVYAGYRLDESTCRLIGPDGAPVSKLTMRVWGASARRQQGHMALETLLGKLQGLDPALPVPERVRADMLAIAQAGTELPPHIKVLLQQAATTVGQLRAPVSASYADSTKFFDGQKSFADVLFSAVPGTSPGVAARRKGITDPDERKLGALLSSAFNAELAKSTLGRELLARFRGPKGEVMPDVMVLKLTQSANDPNAPGAQYDSSGDRMVINHWELARTLQASLTPEKFARIKNRLADAKQVSSLLSEDPSLLPVIVENLDITYYHELLHAAQARRNRFDDEMLRGNLPSANALANEHEAHREHCRYLLSKNAATVDRNAWRDYCLGMLRDPDAFKDGITRQYMASFFGSAIFEDIAARQTARRDAARALETAGGLRNWATQKLKQFGFTWGDSELVKLRNDSDERERRFLEGVPALRREAGGALVAFYESTGSPDRALSLATSLPSGSLDGGEKRLEELADKTIAWMTRAGSPELRSARLAAVATLAARLEAQKKAWPAALITVYERDARAMAEELLASAMTKPPAGREELLIHAEAWTKVLEKPGDLPARIARARTRK